MRWYGFRITWRSRDTCCWSEQRWHFGRSLFDSAVFQVSVCNGPGRSMKTLSWGHGWLTILRARDWLPVSRHRVWTVSYFDRLSLRKCWLSFVPLISTHHSFIITTYHLRNVLGFFLNLTISDEKLLLYLKLSGENWWYKLCLTWRRCNHGYMWNITPPLWILSINWLLVVTDYNLTERKRSRNIRTVVSERTFACLDRHELFSQWLSPRIEWKVHNVVVKNCIVPDGLGELKIDFSGKHEQAMDLVTR